MKREARLLPDKRCSLHTVTDLMREEGAEIPHRQAYVCFWSKA